MLPSHTPPCTLGVESAQRMALDSLLLRNPCRCLVDTTPNPGFSAEQRGMLLQFAELAVREIEKSRVGR